MRTQRSAFPYRAICLALIAAAMAPCPPMTRAGVVRTMDGKTYEGELRLENSQFAIVAKSGRTVVDPANILQAIFQDRERERSAPAPLAPRKPNAPPPPWNSQDIGPAALPGRANAAGGQLTIRSSGGEIGAAADSLHFVYQSLAGDGEIIAHVQEIQAANDQGFAGLAIRESLDPGARQACLLVSADRGVVFVSRIQNGAEAKRAPAADAAAPLWLKLVRRGFHVTAYRATQPGDWGQPIGSVDLILGGRVAAGLAVCSSAAGGHCAATIDEYSVNWNGRSSGPPGPGLQGQSLVLRNGTILARCSIDCMDTARVRGSAAGKPFDIAMADVARLLLRPLGDPLLDKIPPRATGVLLNKGDFVEGDFRGIENENIKLSSVLMGLSNFASNDVAALLIRPSDAARAHAVVRMMDGSIYMADSLQIDGAALVAQDAACGVIRIDPSAIIEIQAGAARFDLLNDLRPRIEVSPGVDPGRVCFLDPSASPVPMTFSTIAPDHGLLLAGGASLTYDLHGQYRFLLARAGVPESITPGVPLRIVVLADNKEIHRSGWRTSLDEPASLSLSIVGVKTLTLRVESPTPDLPAWILWSDATIVK